MNNNDFNNPGNSFMDYMEFLYANGYTLDENGNVVPIKDDSKTLVLIPSDDEDKDE